MRRRSPKFGPLRQRATCRLGKCLDWFVSLLDRSLGFRRDGETLVFKDEILGRVFSRLQKGREEMFHLCFRQIVDALFMSISPQVEPDVPQFAIKNDAVQNHRFFFEHGRGHIVWGCRLALPDKGGFSLHYLIRSAPGGRVTAACLSCENHDERKRKKPLHRAVKGLSRLAKDEGRPLRIRSNPGWRRS